MDVLGGVEGAPLCIDHIGNFGSKSRFITEILVLICGPRSSCAVN